MDHGGGHGGHGGHGSPATPSSCSMSMLFTWDPTDLCVVFRWWHVRTYFDLFLTFIAIVVLAAGYELLRFRMRVLDNSGAPSPMLSTGESASVRLPRALGYAAQVGYSYFLMLVFMTYNGWAWAAVCVGAFLGYWFWGTRAERQLSCH